MSGSLWSNVCSTLVSTATVVTDTAAALAKPTGDNLRKVATKATNDISSSAAQISSSVAQFTDWLDGIAKQAQTEIQKKTEEVQKKTEEVQKKTNNILNNMAKQLNNDQIQTDVLEQLGESLAHWILSEKDSPSKEDVLKAIDIVLPRYQQDMSTIITDLKNRLEGCIKYAATQCEKNPDISSPAHNPTKNQLEQTTKADMVNNITGGALAGGVAGAVAGGPGGAAVGAATGALVGGGKAVVQSLFVNIIKEAEKQRIIREAKEHKKNRTSQSQEHPNTPSVIPTTAP